MRLFDVRRRLGRVSELCADGRSGNLRYVDFVSIAPVKRVGLNFSAALIRPIPAVAVTSPPTATDNGETCSVPAGSAELAPPAFEGGVTDISQH